VREELNRALAFAQGNPARMAALEDVRANVEFLELARPVHNPTYARAVLARAHGDLAALLAEWGAGVPAEPPWLQAPYEAECLDCHFGIEHVAAAAFGRSFPHRVHAVGARLRCEVCHGGMEQHGILRIDASACDGCHARIREPMAGAGPENCLGCHVADIGRRSEAVRFPHARHVEAGL